jgi:hypothetical protein
LKRHKSVPLDLAQEEDPAVQVLGHVLAVRLVGLDLEDSVAAVAAMVALPAVADSVVPAAVLVDLLAAALVDTAEPLVDSVVDHRVVPMSAGIAAMQAVVEHLRPVATNLEDRASYLEMKIRRAARRKLRSSPRVPKKRNGEIGVGTAWSTRTNCPAMRQRRAVTSSPCASKCHRCVTDGGWTTS